MINLDHFRNYVLDPTLKSIGLYSESASNLLLGTALVESNLEHLRQLGGGSAVSVMQIEPATYTDLKGRLERYHKELKLNILSTLYMHSLPKTCDYLCGNLTAAVIFARLKYYFNPSSLPPYDNANLMANYHKSIYNTYLGKTDVSKSVYFFEEAIKNKKY